MIIPDFSNIRGSVLTEKYIKQHYNEFYCWLNDNYPSIPFRERLYLYINKLSDRPVCKVCSNPVNFINLTKGYYQYCSLKCSNSSKEVKNLKKQTTISKHGSVEEAYKKRMEKAKQTNLERYGVENASQCDFVKEKVKQTNLERYGVECSLQCDTVKEKAKQTNLERYGVKYAQQNAKIAEKSNNIKKLHIIKKYNDIIDIQFNNGNTIYICSCPHNKCNKCERKSYDCNSITYYNRRYKQLEVCTNLLPEQPSRSTGISLELFVRDILDEYNIEYICNSRDIINPKELDIYIPSKNLAIECNGIYWHSNKDPKYHVNKYKLCEYKGVQLFTIWEDQIINKPDIISSMVKTRLGIYDSKIYARKCIIKEVSTQDCSNFLNDNHLQGNLNAPIRLGLYYNNELVSVMTFGRGRSLMNSINDEYEMYRFCNKLNTVVVGGASKLFKYFIKLYNPTHITSYCSNDISCGNLYNKLGFEYSNCSNSYWYINTKTMKRYHRFKFRRSELDKIGCLNDADPTFFEKTKCKKIYDCGQTKFIYKNIKQNT